MILVIDYGMGNIRSVVKAFEKYSDNVVVSGNPEDINKADAVVLPGDGAYAMAMKHLHEKKLIDPLKKYINENRPFLGICLGFQLLFSESEEFGGSKGFNIIPGRVEKFKTNGFKVPHMGWNEVNLKNRSKYLEGVNNKSYFYFIHSFYPLIDDESWIVGTVEYDKEFVCMVGKGNVLATQFHPEKSHEVGLRIIKNFIKLIK